MDLKWMYLSVKWNLKSITFWMLASSAILLLMMLYHLSLAREDTGRILVYTGDSKQAKEVVSELTEDAYHGFDFEATESVEALQDAVYRKEALAGIEFTDRFDAAVAGGVPEESVILYSGSDTAVNVILKELIFPCILQASSPAILSSYLKERALPDTEAAQEDVIQNNSRLIKTWKVRLFSVKEVPVSYPKKGRRHVYGMAFILLPAVFFLTVFEEKRIHRDFFLSRKRGTAVRYILESAAIRTVLLTLCLVVSNVLADHVLF